MKTRISCQNEYGTIDSILLKKVNDAFIDQSHIDNEWSGLEFTALPDFENAMHEYNAFLEIIKSYSPTIHFIPENKDVNLDSIYCRDAAISTDHGLIICSMGKELRRNEPINIKMYALANAIPILGEIALPGTVEGGDTAWIDEHTLAVGHSYRTNIEGIFQLKKILRPFDIEVIEISLPHYKGTTDVFHLMSIFSPIDRDVAVVYSPLMPITFRNYLLDRAWHLIEVPDEEFESMACNVLALKPRTCMMVDGNPITKERLNQAGCVVHAYSGKEISIKGGGGPTCLTRPLQRKLIDTGFG